MSILAWLLLGLIAGFIASKIVNKSGQGLLLDIVIGIVGALIGGSLFNSLGGVGITGFNLWSLFVAVVGAVIALLIYHAITRRRRL
ncbi:MAG: GlsB/YeaQ/YmgE family stress response membrane protein [Solirubrobacterales bacterium]